MGSQINHVHQDSNCTTGQGNQPWLDERGFKLPDDQLKLISRSWSPETWERYLQSLEGHLTESQLHPFEYDDRAERMEFNCFEFAETHSRAELSNAVKKVLAELSPRQQQVVNLIFWNGKSERQVAETLRISRSSVRDVRSRALKRLAGILRTPTTKFPFMRGEISPLRSETGEADDKKVLVLAERFMPQAG